MATPSPQFFQFDDEAITYQVVYWEEFVALCQQVGEQIVAADQKIDALVSLAKGGWPIGRIVADVLGVRQGYSIGMETYSGINVHASEPVVYQDISSQVVVGKTVLLVDDVADSGVSLRFAQQHLIALGAARVVTATSFFKPHSSIRPDFFAAETTAWILFPFERYESRKLLSKRWAAAGVTAEEIEKRLLQLDLAPEST